MSIRHLLSPLAATVLWLAVALPGSATVACTDVDGWNAGRQGHSTNAVCGEDGYAEAFRLGEALADLNARHAALETRIAASPDDAGVLRRQQRQIDVDIEAIHGVATLRGWPVSATQEEAK